MNSIDEAKVGWIGVALCFYPNDSANTAGVIDENTIDSVQLQSKVSWRGLKSICLLKGSMKQLQFHFLSQITDLESQFQ